jgi:hypothetical protein
MFVYEFWATLLILGIVFVVLYPQDAFNLTRLASLAPKLIRVWLIQRWMMIRLKPRMMLDHYLIERRLNKIRKRHNRKETTSTKDRV